MNIVIAHTSFSSTFNLYVCTIHNALGGEKGEKGNTQKLPTRYFTSMRSDILGLTGCDDRACEYHRSVETDGSRGAIVR